ncbi:MAG: DUF1592 domain-containing protein [Alphaproteobacteria bacterium]|nr:DUF1592 domain-containing protein [Alphaproteobacteria bacterium]
MVDLLGLREPTHLSEHFVTDATHGTFDNESHDLFVNPVLWQQYLIAAEALTDQVMTTPELRDRVFDPDPKVDPEAWIRAFVARVHRRPLTDTQVEAYLELFATGAEVWNSGDASEDGARQVLQTALQSPWFLYRTESEGTPRDGIVDLDAWDLASKLSYALWNTMPDDELFALAESGELLDEEVYAATVRRMVTDERARHTLQDLHDQLFKIDSYANIAPDVTVYPQFSPDLVRAFQDEATMFLDDVVQHGTVHDMMTTTRTFVNPPLADLYGVGPVPDDGEMHAVDLDPSQRAGLLTLAGRLALQADPTTDSPIRRGIYVNTTVLCVELPPPPAGVNPQIPQDPNLTTRQRVDAYTGDGTCGQGCHSTYINPVGFAYEHYGALGEWRDDERGLPLDASATYTFDDGPRSWNDALELASILGSSPQVHDCYVQHLLTYLYQRYPGMADEALIDQLGTLSLTDDAPILDLVADLLLDPSFRVRAIE